MGAASDNEDEAADVPVLDLLRDSISHLSDLIERSEPKIMLENSYNT